jgi:hypothetical protein
LNIFFLKSNKTKYICIGQMMVTLAKSAIPPLLAISKNFAFKVMLGAQAKLEFGVKSHVKNSLPK